MEAQQELLTRVVELLGRVESRLIELEQQKTIKDFYTTSEVAELVGVSEYTVREWCRGNRINATKRMTGRGRSKEWAISHEELQRYRNHGLLPQ